MRSRRRSEQGKQSLLCLRLVGSCPLQLPRDHGTCPSTTGLDWKVRASRQPPQPSSHHGNSLTLKLKLACTKKDQGKERKYNYLQELINPPPCCCCRILLLGCLDAPRHGSSWHLDIPVVSDCTSFSRIRFPSVPFVMNDDQPSPPAHRWHSWR